MTRVEGNGEETTWPPIAGQVCMSGFSADMRHYALNGHFPARDRVGLGEELAPTPLAYDAPIENTDLGTLRFVQDTPVLDETAIASRERE